MRRAQSSAISYTVLPLYIYRFVQLNSVLFSSLLFSLAYSLMHGGLCCKQPCTITVIHYFTDNCQIIVDCALQQLSIRYPYIRRESRFVPTPPALDAPVREGGPRRNIAITCDTEKLELCGHRW